MKLFFILEKLLKKAPEGGLWLRLLNLVLPAVIPFNYGHGYRVLEIGPDQPTRVRIPYRRSNFNHLQGIHACALATGAELTAGLAIISNYSPNTFRIIMSEIRCSYTYQARKTCIAAATALSDSQKHRIADELNTNQQAFVELAVGITDLADNPVCTVLVQWQLKPWSEIKSVT